MTTDFADISHHQANVDLAAYKAAGYTRIVLKATEGTGFTDPMFAARWREAGRLGLKRVAYHFARAKFNGADEFAHFYAVVKAAGGFTKNDMACLDVEDPDTPDQAAAEMRAFTKAAVAKNVRNGIIYTYNWYAVHHAISPSQLPAGWRRLWMADYTVGQADRDIELGAGWTWDQVVARQFTDKAQVPGIGSADDSHFIHEWLTAVDAVSTTTEDDLPSIEDLDNAAKAGKLDDFFGRQTAFLRDKADLAKSDQIAVIARQVVALDAKMSALVAALATASSGQFDLAAVEKAAEQGAADALARVELSVKDAA